MKKLILLSALLLLVASVSAQAPIPPKGIQKVTFGVVFATSASTSFSNRTKPFTLGYNLSPNICIVTAKTYHNVLYGTGDNTGKLINGYMPRKDLGIYSVLVKNLSSTGGYAGIGIEKFIKAENVTFFLFSEAGMAVAPSKGSLKLGVHVNVQSILWRKK